MEREKVMRSLHPTECTSQRLTVLNGHVRRSDHKDFAYPSCEKACADFLYFLFYFLDLDNLYCKYNLKGLTVQDRQGFQSIDNSPGLGCLG